MAGWFCFVLLLGVVLGFTLGKADVNAQTVDNQSTRWMAGTISYGQEDAFMLFDTQTHRLIAYTVTPTKRLEIIAVREISWDLKPIEYGKQNPTVKTMRDDYQKAEKEKLEREKKEKRQRPPQKED
jgi:hypothetical protein